MTGQVLQGKVLCFMDTPWEFENKGYLGSKEERTVEQL